jgi:excisionase family DNA binding protein
MKERIKGAPFLAMNSQRSLLTVREAAEQLGLRECTIRLWLAQRKLPRVNCGRAVRIPAHAIAEFIERNTIPAREERR